MKDLQTNHPHEQIKHKIYDRVIYKKQIFIWKFQQKRPDSWPQDNK